MVDFVNQLHQAASELVVGTHRYCFHVPTLATMLTDISVFRCVWGGGAGGAGAQWRGRGWGDWAECDTMREAGGRQCNNAMLNCSARDVQPCTLPPSPAPTHAQALPPPC